MIKSINEFYSYLAGLIEGSGKIFVPKKIRLKRSHPTNRVNSIGGRKDLCLFQIRFSSNPLELKFLEKGKNISLEKKIIEVIKCGHLRKIKNTNNYILKIGSKNSVLKLIKIVNGKFRTPKVHKFYSLIHYMNNKYNSNISFSPFPKRNLDSLKGFVENTSNLFFNAWVLGFLDVDGCQGNKETHF